MKKYLLFFLLLLPVAVSLYDVELYDGWVTSGNYFDIEDEEYRAIYIRNSNTTVIYMPDGVTAVINLKNETCVKEWLYEVCQEDIKFEKNGEEVPPTIHDQNINISMLITIFFSDIKLDLNRTFSKEDIFLQDTTEVRTELIKIGNEDITNITYIDEYPGSFAIQAKAGCNRRGNTIFWKGDLNNSNKHVCIYQIRPVRETSSQNTVTLSYTLLDKPTTSTYTKEFNIQETPLLFSSSHKDKAHSEENVDFNITLDVLKDIEIKELKIVYPEHFTLKNKSGDFQNINNKLFYKNKDLKEDSVKELFFVLSTGYVGKHQINLSLNYVYDKAVKNIDETFFVNYTGDIFYIDLINKTNRSVLRLNNPGSKQYERIQVFVDEHNFFLAKLERGRFKEFGFPLLENGTHTIKVKFDSVYGQRVTETYHLELGESTFTTDEELEEQVVELPEEEEEEEKRPWINFDIDSDILLTISIIIVATLILLGGLYFIKNKFSKSDIEKEIEELRKHEEELDDELEE